MMMLLCGVAEVQRGKEGEDVRLKECHKQLKAVHKNHEQRRKHTDADARTYLFSAFSEDENEACKREDDDVTGGDVRCKSDHEDRRLQQQPDDFNRGQNEDFNGCWNTGHPKHVPPVVAVAAEACNQEHQGR